MQKWQWRVLGVLALGGSFTGLALGISLLIASSSILAKALTLPFLALYAWGLFCGLWLLERREGSLRQNLYFWLTQVPLLVSSVAGYSFSSGASIYFKFQPDISRWDFSAHFGSQFAYSLLQEKPFVLGINLFAVAVCAYLWLAKRRAPPNPSFKPTPRRGAA